MIKLRDFIRGCETEDEVAAGAEQSGLYEVKPWEPWKGEE